MAIPSIPRAPLITRALGASQREARLSPHATSSYLGPSTSGGPILSPFAHQGSKGSTEKAAFEGLLCCVQVCPLPVFCTTPGPC